MCCGSFQFIVVIYGEIAELFGDSYRYTNFELEQIYLGVLF